MIFLYFNTSSSKWYLGPLLFLAPFLLESIANGIPKLFKNFFSPALGSGFGWTQQESTSGSSESFSTLIFNTVYTVVGLVSFFRFASWVWSGEGRAFLRQLRSGFNAPRAPNGNHGGPAPSRPRATMDQVASVLQKLPTELHRTEEEYKALSAHELRELSQKRGIHASELRGVEKAPLVARLASAGGSSATSCSICCDDYESGDPVRVLPCGHRFHIECVDRWFYASTDYSRPPACPLCNQPLMKPSS